MIQHSNFPKPNVNIVLIFSILFISRKTARYYPRYSITASTITKSKGLMMIMISQCVGFKKRSKLPYVFYYMRRIITSNSSLLFAAMSTGCVKRRPYDICWSSRHWGTRKCHSEIDTTFTVTTRKSPNALERRCDEKEFTVPRGNAKLGER